MVNERFYQLSKVKVVVHLEDLWSEMIAVYKGHRFNENSQVKITIAGSAAVDAGGVRRQVYTQLFHHFACNSYLNLFEGDENHLRPAATAEARSSGLLKMLGKIVAHSICQEGIGFPYLSPTCYWYIIGGEEMAVQHASINDIPPAAALLIKKVRDASDDDQLKSIGQSELSLDVLQYCGIRKQLTVSTNDAICHEIITFNSIGCVSMLLDQLISGLQTLGVHKAMKSFPDLFLPLFVFTGNVSPSDVLEAVFVDKDLSESETQLFKYLHTFIGEASVDELRSFLIHCTGTFKVPLPKSILVDFSDSDAVEAHTCDQSLVLPTGLITCTEYSDFKAILCSIIVYLKDGNIHNPTFNVV